MFAMGKHIEIREEYSLCLVFIHQFPTNSVFTTEVVDPPLKRVRNRE